LTSRLHRVAQANDRSTFGQQNEAYLRFGEFDNAKLGALRLGCVLASVALIDIIPTALMADSRGCQKPSWIENIELCVKKAIKRENIVGRYSHVWWLRPWLESHAVQVGKRF